MKPILLDLFCGAGGCAQGYKEAGFYVIGIDVMPQTRYAGDEFIQADVFDVLEQYALDSSVVHASPPCQHYSVITSASTRNDHPDLIAVVRKCLQATGKPYVIENVENARKHLINPVKLCGTMFGLNVYRHRYFEICPDLLLLTPACKHDQPAILITGTTHRRNKHGKRIESSLQEKKDACGIHWMTSRELDEAVPPAYTRYIGEHLKEALCELSETP